MDWQGIPFRLLDGEMIDRLSVALNAIPKIQVETPVDYTAALATVTATLIAGLIPAGLSWWLFRRNTENTKNERKQQHSFLKSERAEQQSFLKNERELQIKSLEEDRKVQLEISKQNFNMQVLSTNRHAWINELRDRIADVIALAPIYQNSMFEFKLTKTHGDELSLIDFKDFTSPVWEILENKKNSVSEKFYSILSINKKQKKDMGFLIAKITLMLNPNEEITEKIIKSLNKVSDLCTYIDDDIGNLNKAHGELITELKVLTCHAQNCLKAEWERVKKGQ